MACSTVAPPSVSALDEGGQAKGFPSRLMATPQCPIAHEGSSAITAVKVLMAGANQKECSSATARSNCACATALHETGKCTWPRASAGPGCSCEIGRAHV